MPAGLNERLINLMMNLAIFADRSRTHHVHESMKEKCQGKTTSSATQTDAIAAAITKRNRVLIPITIDHSGRLGGTAHEFLGTPE
jgi:hypothetical protein